MKGHSLSKPAWVWMKRHFGIAWSAIFAYEDLPVIFLTTVPWRKVGPFWDGPIGITIGMMGRNL